MKKRILITMLAWLFVAASGMSLTVAESLPPPKWRIGQTWYIETESRQPQTDVPDTKWIAQWQFTIEAIDQFENSDCFRLAITPREHPEPKTIVWVDSQSFMIRRVDSQIPTPNGYVTVSEMYRANRPVPVLGPLSLIPLALPRFALDGLKSGNETERFEYNNSDQVGVKSDSEVAFATEVSQTVVMPNAESMKLFKTSPYVKNADHPNVLEVKLETRHETIRQLWDTSSPWPVFSENETSIARLLDVTASNVPQVPTERAIVPPVESLLVYNTNDHSGMKSFEEGDNREHGVTSYKPWSGPWWPMRNGGLNVPLGKYDKITGLASVAWENKHNLAGNFRELPGWYGFCHAWAAASILEKEPQQVRYISLADSQLPLEIDDQKGIVTACHTRDLANTWGIRFNEGDDQEDYEDLSPEELWQVLNRYVGKHGVPIVLDIEPGSQVWNFPVFEYEVKYRSSGGKYNGVMVIQLADDAVAPNYLGTQVIKKTYTFTFRMKDGCIVEGSGQWTGNSVNDHPDFAWSPYKCVTQNPEVKHDKVVQLVYNTNTISSSLSNVNTEIPMLMQPNPLVLADKLVAWMKNKPSSFLTDITVDQFDGGGYRPGETFFLQLTTERSGYLTLVLIHPDGKASFLMPQLELTEQIVAKKEVVRITRDDVQQNSQTSPLPVKTIQGFFIPELEGPYQIIACITEKPFDLHTSQYQTQQQVMQQVKSDEKSTVFGAFSQDSVPFYVSKQTDISNTK